MALDAEAVRAGCRGAEVTTARQLCRSELDRFRAPSTDKAPLTVGCTQEAALFDEVAEEAGAEPPHHLRQHPRDGGLVERRR